MVVIFCGRAAMTHWCLKGELPQHWALLTMIPRTLPWRQTAAPAWSQSHRCCWTYKQTVKVGPINTRRHNRRCGVSSWLPPFVFSRFCYRGRSFRMKECCWLRGRETERWGQMVASRSLSERGRVWERREEDGGRHETSERGIWKDGGVGVGWVVGDISHCCKFINLSHHLHAPNESNESKSSAYWADHMR